MTEQTTEQVEIPVLTNEDLTQALVNVATAVGQLRLQQQQLLAGAQKMSEILVAHKKAIIEVSREVGRVAEELNSQDARIVVMRSWLKSLGPEPTPETGVPND